MKAEKALANLQYFNEMTREDLHNAVLHELAPLEAKFVETDNTHGKEAFNVFLQTMLFDAEEVASVVMKAAEVYKRIAPQVEED